MKSINVHSLVFLIMMINFIQQKTISCEAFAFMNWVTSVMLRKNNPSTSNKNNDTNTSTNDKEILKGSLRERIVTCPKMAQGTFCMTLWDPYICLNDTCQYGNDCEAMSAGLNIKADCKQKCPQVIDGHESCTNNDHSHYICNIDCYYVSKCDAVAAGFNIEKECKKM